MVVLARIPALRQEDGKFEGNLNYIVRPSQKYEPYLLTLGSKCRILDNDGNV
jgi:hypothetical protein